MLAEVNAKFVQASSEGKYVRGQVIVEGSGVQRVYVDTSKNPDTAVEFSGLSELEAVRLTVDVFANTPKAGGSAYLSIRVVKVAKVGARVRAASA